MANKDDKIHIACNWADYQLIHRAVVAAAKQAKRDENAALFNDLSGVLLRLGESEGLSQHHLSVFSLWDVE